jgi:hypothetical protein
MAEEKGRKFRIRVRPTRWNHIGVFLSLVGFILILICLVGGFTSTGRGIYFAKVQNANVTATFGLFGYCTDQAATSKVVCQQDEAVKQIPFGKTLNHPSNLTMLGFSPFVFFDCSGNRTQHIEQHISRSFFGRNDFGRSRLSLVGSSTQPRSKNFSGGDHLLDL